MDKSPDAFRTISEVADDLDLPQHVLRFWETRFGQIRPLKRGGGRRYYRPDDVDLLRGIRALLYGQGYTIRGVQRILKEKGIRYVQALGRGEQVAPAPGPAESEGVMPPAPFPGDAASYLAHDADEIVGAGMAGFADDPSTEQGRSRETPALGQQGREAPAKDGHSRDVRPREVLPPDILMRLSGVLAELLECRRLIASARGTVVTDPDGA